MLRDVRPAFIGEFVPTAVEQTGPVDNSDDKRVDDNGGVKGRVERLQESREAVEQGAAGAGVGEGVDGGEQKVKGYAPVGERGEVAELGLGGAAVVGRVDALVGEDEDEGCEGVEGLLNRSGIASQFDPCVSGMEAVDFVGKMLGKTWELNVQ